MRKYLILLVLVFALVLTACGTQQQGSEPAEPAEVEVVEETTEEPTEVADEQEFTLEELQEFDGKEGRPAYVAVDGIVYDVSEVAGWAGGEHNGAMAGTDATEDLNNSPHGPSKLTDLPVVGKIVE